MVSSSWYVEINTFMSKQHSKLIRNVKRSPCEKCGAVGEKQRGTRDVLTTCVWKSNFSKGKRYVININKCGAV